jgi:cytochrome c oxidase accessory protein FixG
LLNILEREFILFGIRFAPQDFYLFAIGMLIFFVFIILFTVIYGRLFCGWICPQTVFMELVFRKIEYWIDGDYRSQIKLNQGPWNTDKTIRRIAKHSIFLLISIGISNYFLAYIIGIDEVLRIISDPITKHMTGFLFMIGFSLTFYGVFSRLREQVCTTICPYGRLQGVLLDQKSLVVAYDYIRGEPRGKLHKTDQYKNDERSEYTPLPIIHTASRLSDTEATAIVKGDCVDCKLCIHVCPTGIDIRHGTQLECINCTACMDACDDVMHKIHKPAGLIRIDSIEGIEKGVRNIWNTRVKAYSLILLVLIGIEGVLISMRSDLDVLFLRTPGMTTIEKESGITSNLYNFNIINKTSTAYKLTFKIRNISGKIEVIGQYPVLAGSGKKVSGSAFIDIPSNYLNPGKNDLKIDIYNEKGMIMETAKTTFFVKPK